MEISDIKKNIEKILDNNKAQNITSINLKNKSYIADYMIIASGTLQDIYNLFLKF
jgi:ribosome-associated protein